MVVCSVIGSPTNIYESLVEAKPVEGLAMLFALHRETGASSVKSSIDQRLPDFSPEIVAEAQAKSKELLVDTPILHYLPKYGI